MDPKPELIREDIDETRSALTGKLESLEGQLRGNLETAKQTVEGTIENVKDSIRHLSPLFQTAQHPYMMVSGALATGFITGRLIQGKPAQAMPWASSMRSETDAERTGATKVPGTTEYKMITESRRQLPASSEGPSLLERFTEEFDDEIQLVKGMVLKGVLEAAADMMKKSVPKWSSHIDVVKQSVASKIPSAGTIDAGKQGKHEARHSGL